MIACVDWKQIPGYWNDGVSTDPASKSWNWTADAKQRAAMQAAKAAIQGANGQGEAIFELFSNSPMWWQLTNLNPSGNGNNDNLRPDAYQYHGAIFLNISDRIY